MHGWLPTARLYFGGGSTSERGAISEVTEAQLDKWFSDMIKGAWSAYSAKILTKVREAQEKGLASILQSVLKPPVQKRKKDRALSADRAYHRLEAFLNRQSNKSYELGSLQNFEKRYSKDWPLAVLAEDIDRIEDEIAEVTDPTTRFEGLIRRMFAGPKEIKITPGKIEVIGSRGESLDLGNLSSGEKHVLRILAEALIVNGGTILIDEPELSLHIDWQRHLVESIRLLNPDTQLILATHSPEVLALLPDTQIFRL